MGCVALFAACAADGTAEDVLMSPDADDHNERSGYVVLEPGETKTIEEVGLCSSSDLDQCVLHINLRLYDAFPHVDLRDYAYRLANEPEYQDEFYLEVPLFRATLTERLSGNSETTNVMGRFTGRHENGRTTIDDDVRLFDYDDDLRTSPDGVRLWGLTDDLDAAFDLTFEGIHPFDGEIAVWVEPRIWHTSHELGSDSTEP